MAPAAQLSERHAAERQSQKLDETAAAQHLSAAFLFVHQAPERISVSVIASPHTILMSITVLTVEDARVLRAQLVTRTLLLCGHLSK